MEILFLLVAIIFSVVLHEVSHGYVAYFLGDPTAKLAGRLTLNPLKHLDPFGSFIFPLFVFILTKGGTMVGWAKPVPVNPYNFRDQKYGNLKVAIAGPLANIFLAFSFGFLLKFLPQLSGQFNDFLMAIISINLFLAFFNLLPIPPLDGSHILFSFLPISEETKFFLARFGIIILFLLLPFILPIVSFLSDAILNLFLK
jgi:Zn-dependent protease